MWFVLAQLAVAACASAPPEREIVLYPPPPDTTRIQYLASFSNERDVGGGGRSFLNVVTGSNEQGKPIFKPYGIATVRGKAYVCDMRSGAVDVIDLEERKLDYFNPGGFGALQQPMGCSVDPETRFLYVTDRGRNQVVVFDTAGAYVTSFGEGEGNRVLDVAARYGRVFVADGHAKKIRVFVYVNDFGTWTSRAYSLDGELLLQVGTLGDQPGTLFRPKHLAVDRDGLWYIVDAAFENVQIFNEGREMLMDFGGPYRGPGGMILPSGITVDYENTAFFEEFVADGLQLEYLIWVTNQFGPELVSVYGRVHPVN
jgi:DNA-binding beta-propeller fold protein YncE